ncbi:LysR family transcriptional regulator [Pseudoduganella umbonata]|uniref:DNA-binding transcriptional LysR family regulator n=1 Tax=Pseudoduganella umbonata TaxID=864828 RepID=A0A4P8HUK1_9BURK|nr:LysR family transcriptional regulator [Pseudoduganella umbonata]MBB3223438.1 DNA-binding transcriptional LysR family regulator [Pseudoduganella umbonata]QCP13669.1 LysR family transcriptional regulator [Pseudoduganella umbonata]
METLSNLECFVRTADAGSFSEAARRLGLTPAAVSRNVAMLEKNLAARLFHRSTRRLTLTEAGERLREGIAGNLEELQSALAAVSTGRLEPAGTLKVSMSPSIGMGWLMPVLPAFLARFPRVRPEWHFENRQVDLVGEGYDAAIGGGFALRQGVVARRLAPAHVIAVASPGYLRTHTPPGHPSEAGNAGWIALRSLQSGRIRTWVMRNEAGAEVAVDTPPALVLSDPAAVREAALLGLGIAMLAVPDVLPHLEQGSLVRVLPDWHADVGVISLYYASRAQLPAKTRAFVDFVTDAFERDRLAERFAALPSNA